MGTRGPTSARTRATISPSMSGWLSDTAAPCWARRTPSHGPRLRSASSISPTLRSKASSVIVPIGSVFVKTSGTSSTPSREPASRYPAMVV